MIFLKCKIRFIYVGFNCKRKKWGKKMSGNFAIKGGGGRRPNGKCLFKFHFCFFEPFPYAESTHANLEVGGDYNPGDGNNGQGQDCPGCSVSHLVWLGLSKHE